MRWFVSVTQQLAGCLADSLTPDSVMLLQHAMWHCIAVVDPTRYQSVRSPPRTDHACLPPHSLSVYTYMRVDGLQDPAPYMSLQRLQLQRLLSSLASTLHSTTTHLPPVSTTTTHHTAQHTAQRMQQGMLRWTGPGHQQAGPPGGHQQQEASASRVQLQLLGPECIGCRGLGYGYTTGYALPV